MWGKNELWKSLKRKLRVSLDSEVSVEQTEPNSNLVSTVKLAAEAPQQSPIAPSEEKKEKSEQKIHEGLLIQRNEIRESVDSSSDKNRNFLIAFLGAMLYLAVTIGSAIQ